ncbi:MAG: hypothetical protein ABEK03_00550 [Candidatus Bipolaricaulia bacterium]
MTIINVHQWLGYAIFLVGVIVTIGSFVAARREEPGALRGLAGSFAGLMHLQVLLGLAVWFGVFGVQGQRNILHLIAAVLAAVIGQLAARQLRSSESMHNARWFHLGTLALLVAAIGIASM